MQNILKYYIPLFFLLTVVTACETERLDDAMVEFDQAFIPTFYYTYNEDLAEASKAMLVLDSKWKKFDAEFKEYVLNGHNREESFQMISAWLEEADCALKNKDAFLALTQLDHARYELMDLRWREGMTYYLDKVWDLEAIIEILSDTSGDPMIDLLEWEELSPMVCQLEEAWKDVLNSTWEKEHFDFNATETFEEATRKYALGQTIKNYIITIDYADRCKLEDAAEKMEQAYLEYIVVFGDFDLMKTFFAANSLKN